MVFFRRKKRKYPIKRDNRGLSIRQRAFSLFDEQFRPSQIYKQQLLKAKPKTLLRYYEDWKKKGDHISYLVIKSRMKKNPDLTEYVIKALSVTLDMPVEEVIKRLEKPWGLKQALRGQWPNHRLEREQNDVESRLNGGLWLMHAAEVFHNSPREFVELILELITLNANTTLEITKKGDHLICKKEENGEVTTIDLDYHHEIN